MQCPSHSEHSRSTSQAFFMCHQPLALKTVPSKVLDFGIVLAFAFAFLVFVFAFTFTFTFLVAFAFLALSSFYPASRDP